MRFLTAIAMCLLLGTGIYWMWTNYPEVRTYAGNLFRSGKIQTLEIRHSAEGIMEQHRHRLLKDAEHSYLEPDVIFHPYLLMEVKYTSFLDRTGEGIILWSLVDGEMVINTTTWEKTHGFADCIAAYAGRTDFKIINALVANGGTLDREALSHYLNVDTETLDTWLEGTRRKNLVVESGNHYRLHMQNPHMQVIPETKLDQWLVTKQTSNASRMPRKFHPSQIESIAKAAFGNDFTIRKTTEIYLPVYSIVIQNPDGSQMTTYWNALNGKRFSQSYQIE